ncbi:MAG: phosphoribosylamine--glycine ligase [Lentisphaerae bacterium]|jgi:phosphoribosylamine--glycine ligase|nr:phosphoribosylamine--glycine ligase [Lentisphaerota bacterium]
MNVLIIGGGGREHALAWKIRQSSLVDQLYCAPGNPGMRDVIAVPESDLQALADFAEKNAIGLTMVGPEAPLCAGIVDLFRARGLRIVGPDRHAAQLEGSKSFAKDFMRRHGIPTADATTFDNEAGALAYLRRHGAPIVIKADGLAAGKGVIVAMTMAEAEEALRSCFGGAFGQAGNRVLLEECLFGEEASILALCDGKSIIPLASSQDHKRALDGDLGPNTGGMGAYSPAPIVTDELWQEIDRLVLQPFLSGCRRDALNFRGVIYAGLMLTAKGPKVLEFNVRFGDPETQAILMRLDSDLVEALVATADQCLADIRLCWSPKAAVCVVMAARGYPGSYAKGAAISGLGDAEAGGAVVFHAGTAVKDGRMVTAGGRVLGVTALGDDIAAAVANAYDAVAKISWDGAQFRRDIAHRALGK